VLSLLPQFDAPQPIIKASSWACYYIGDIFSVVVWDGPRHTTWIFLKFRGRFRHHRSIPIHQILNRSPAPGTIFLNLVNNLGFFNKASPV
jgi:hypothetical protein